MSHSRILVVEDEPAIAETIIYALETDGFEVVHCETGKAALEIFAESNLQFVILDVGLPDLSGFDVCREIRKGSEVPILFLTAREGEIDRVVGLELGGDDYVIKPFSPRELTARVHAILRRSIRPKAEPVDSGVEDVIRHGPLELQPERYRALMHGNDLGLSRYEFGMLRVFVEKPERVFSRDQLMELVWDEPEAALDRTVDAHIKTLRKKMAAIDGSFVPIVTHRGLGYSFSSLERW